MTGSVEAPPYLAGASASLCCLGCESDLDQMERWICDIWQRRFFKPQQWSLCLGGTLGYVSTQWTPRVVTAE